MGRVIRALAVALAALLPGASHAGGWGEPSRAEARYGLRAVVCRPDGHGGTCLALACRGGRPVLVSASGGGGPMEGPTRVSTGRTAFDLRFTFDGTAVDVLGIAAAEAPLDRSQVEAILKATRITLASSEPGHRHEFPGRGLADRGGRAAASCR